MVSPLQNLLLFLCHLNGLRVFCGFSEKKEKVMNN